MPGTKSGAAKTKAKVIELYGADHYARIGAIGGKSRSPLKGFGTNRELARTAGSIGGKISRRSKSGLTRRGPVKVVND